MITPASGRDGYLVSKMHLFSEVQSVRYEGFSLVGLNYMAQSTECVVRCSTPPCLLFLYFITIQHCEHRPDCFSFKQNLRPSPTRTTH